MQSKSAAMCSTFFEIDLGLLRVAWLFQLFFKAVFTFEALKISEKYSDQQLHLLFYQSDAQTTCDSHANCPDKRANRAAHNYAQRSCGSTDCRTK